MRVLNAEVFKDAVEIITPVEIIQVADITPVSSSESTYFSRAIGRVEDTGRLLGEVSQFPYDPGVNLLVKCHLAHGICELWNTSGNLMNNKFVTLIVWNAYIAPLLKLFNDMSISKVSVQTGQPRLPRPLPKPPLIGGVDSKTNTRLLAANFSRKMQPAATALAVIFQEWKVLKLSNGCKVKLQVVNPTVYTFYGVIETADLVARHRLHHGLVAMERSVREGVSKTVHRYWKVANYSFNRSERVKKHRLHHILSASEDSFDPSSTLDDSLGISSFGTNTYILVYYVCVLFDRKGIDVEEEWGAKGIAEYVSYIHEFLSVHVRNDPRVAASNASKIKIMIYGSLSAIIRCFTLLYISEIITHPCHVILCKVINVQKVSKNDEVNSGILQAANHIMILFVKVFTCSSQGIYNTPSCRMKFTDMNLEDKVLFEDGSIVMNSVHFGKVANYVWDPGIGARY